MNRETRDRGPASCPRPHVTGYVGRQLLPTSSFPRTQCPEEGGGHRPCHFPGNTCVMAAQRGDSRSCSPHSALCGRTPGNVTQPGKQDGGQQEGRGESGRSPPQSSLEEPVPYSAEQVDEAAFPGRFLVALLFTAASALSAHREGQAPLGTGTAARRPLRARAGPGQKPEAIRRRGSHQSEQGWATLTPRYQPRGQRP